VLRGDTARRPGAPLAERVCFEDTCQGAASELEEADHEGCPAGDDRVCLRARIAELAVDRRHDREGAIVEREPPAGHVLHRAGCQPLEAPLDDGNGLPGRDQAGHVGLGEIQGQA
jgi:hypothetical protein